MKFKVTTMNTRVIDNIRPVVDAWGRSDTGQRVHAIISGVEPYFYLDEEPAPHNLIKSFRQEGVNLHNEPLWKVIVRIPDQVPEVRKHYPIHYEADVLFNDRVRYDCGIKSVIEIPDKDGFTTSRGEIIYPSEIQPSKANIETRYWVMDIETSDEHGFADPKYPTGEVLSWSVVDSFTKTVYACISKQVDVEKVKRLLQNPEWLKKRIRTENEVKPYKGKIKIWCVKDEYRVFLKLVKLWNYLRPDYVLGWNNKNYDIPYLMERSGEHSARVVNRKNFRDYYPCPDFKEISLVDVMTKFESLYKAKKGELESAKLEFCATTELGYGKLKHSSKFIDLYNNNPEKFIAYNIWDSIITERINKSKGILPYYSTLAETAGTSIENTDYFSLLIDALILHRLKGIVVLPSRSIIQNPITIKGAYTHEPITGSKEWVVVIDFKQQYPGAIRSLNMSPETLVDENYDGEVYTTPSGNRYRKTPRGLLPMVLDEQSEKRDKIKAKMKEYEIDSPEYKKYNSQETSYKFFMNAFFGVMATKKGIFRLTDQRIGYDIPDVARYFTKKTIKLLEKNNIEVIYGDTDSCLFRFPGISDPEEVLRKAKRVVKWLNKMYSKIARRLGNTGEPHWFRIDVEMIYEVYFQSGREEGDELIGKKRYAGLKAWQDGKWLFDVPKKDRIVIKGYEVRRSNAAAITRELQRKVLTMILEGAKPKELRHLIRATIDSERKNPGVELGFPTGIQKESYKEKGKPIHIRAMEWSNENLGYHFKYGDKPIWFYGSVKGKPSTRVFAIDWGDKLPEGTILKIDLMIERCIKKPLIHIIEGFGYKWSELVEGQNITKQETLL